MSLFALAAKEGCSNSTVLHEVNRERHRRIKSAQTAMQVGLTIMNLGFIAMHAEKVGLGIALGARAYEFFENYNVKRQLDGHHLDPKAGHCWHEASVLKGIESGRSHNEAWFHRRTQARLGRTGTSPG